VASGEVIFAKLSLSNWAFRWLKWSIQLYLQSVISATQLRVIYFVQCSNMYA